MSTAKDAREQGNELYKNGRLEEAEKAYRTAASLAPEDPAPLSNLSAVKFELGQYEESASLIREALSLAAAQLNDGSLKQKLYARLAKCVAHLKQEDSSATPSGEWADEEGRSSVQSSLALLKSWASSNDAELRKSVVDRLPRFKAHLQDVSEYFPFGHDSFGQTLRKDMLVEHKDLAVLFCGSGDARNVYCTMLEILLHQLSSGMVGPGDSHVHFTMLDLKAAAMARSLLMFDLMRKIAIMKAVKTPGSEDAVTVLTYMYSAQVIPPAVAEKIQDQLEEMIKILKKEDRDVHEVFYIAPPTRRKIIRVYKQWQQPLDDVYKAPRVRPYVMAHDKTSLTKERLQGEEYREDNKFFEELGILVAERPFFERREPAILPLLKAYREGKVGARDELSKYLDKTWVTNPTLMDIDFEVRRRDDSIYRDPNIPGQTIPASKRYSQFEFSPFSLVKAFPKLPMRSPGIFGYLKPVWEFTAMLQVKCIDGGLMFELVVGEMADFMEHVRYDCADDRKQRTPKINPATFPRSYDVIHMSNIPDYIGGMHTAMLYAQPLLRKDRKSSYMSCNCLLNPPQIGTFERYHAEYLLLSQDDKIATHFGLKRNKKYDQKVRSDMPTIEGLTMTDFIVTDYMVWNNVKTGSDEPAPRHKLFARPFFERWMHAHYLKLCLPYPRPTFDSAPVRAPLNLTAFLRLVQRMHEIGYPAHWLSAVLAAVCSGTLEKATVRAPRSLVIDPSDLAKSFPPRDICVQPWRAEITSLLSIWLRLLPFGVILPTGSLVGPEEIAEYSIKFDDVHRIEADSPHFVLVFYDAGAAPHGLPEELHDLLLDDEASDNSEASKQMREGHVHVFNTAKYITETKTATFWVRKDFVEGIREGQWRVALWRTDTWSRATGEVPAADGIFLVRTWAGKTLDG